MLTVEHLNFTPRRILEYGCGTGRNLVFLKEAFPDSKIFGTDISEKSLEVAKKKKPFCETFTIRDDNISNFLESFDLIFVAGVFHHIPPKERLFVLEVIKSLLAPQGVVFIFENNPYNPLVRRLVKDCPFDADAQLLSYGELQNLLIKAHLPIEVGKYYLFIPPKFSSLLKFEKYLRWLPIGGQYFIKAKKR